MVSDEYLLVCLMEECSEVIQAVSKSLRFGLDSTYPKSHETNRDQLSDEISDVVAVVTELSNRGLIDYDKTLEGDKHKAKLERIKKYHGDR